MDAGHTESAKAADLRTDFPRSGRTTLAGYAWLARLADKVRAQQTGTLGDYVAFYPISLGFLERLSVSPDEFSSLISAGCTDHQLVVFLDARASDVQRASANRWVLFKHADDLRRQDGEERCAPDLMPST